MYVTVRHLHAVRNEQKKDTASVRLDIKALSKKMDARFGEVDSRFHSLDGRFSSIDARFNEIDARFSKMDARFNEIDARFSKMDARFNEIDARFSKMDARFDTIDARFNLIDAKIETLTAGIHRMLAIFEEQNAKNNFVLDGYTSLYDNQKNFDLRLKKIEDESI